MLLTLIKIFEMEGLKEIGQEIGKLFVNAIENQSKQQSERDDLNYLRYRNMIAEELKRHSEDVDRQVKHLEKRFHELNIKGAKEALGGEKRIDEEVSFQNIIINIDQQGETGNNSVKSNSQDSKVSVKNGPGEKGEDFKSPMHCKQSHDKDDVRRLAIEVGSNGIKLTIDGDQRRPKGRDSEAFIKVCSEAKSLMEGSTSKSANHSVGLPKSTYGPCGKCRAMGHIRRECPRIAKKDSQ